MTPRIHLNDTTLRDGEQAPGVAFTLAERIAIAEALAAAGVPEIEAGTPAMGPDEVSAIATIARSVPQVRTLAWCRLSEKDLALAARAGVRAVNLSIPLSDRLLATKLGIDREEALARIKRVVPRALDMGMDVAIGGEDASRSDPEHVVRVAETAAALGAFRLRLADTVGVLDPFSTADLVGTVCRAAPIAIEFHGHDDLGLATANSLAAVRAGATHVSVTVLGLGERAGNAPLEELAVALDRLGQGETGIDLARLPRLAEVVARASGRPVPEGKAIVGRDVFTHESGIHVSAILKEPETYQALDPALVGRGHAIVIGKHSGAAALAHALGETVPDALLPTLRARIIRQAARTKRPIAPGELRAMVRDLEAQVAGSPLPIAS
ncbi:homocitrate synthase [Acuticoccus sediminis]|uniref:homocitrate synthase n=1 Tax=Acuticoccus sediminis TaxID=2184697 RepID=UPI001CFDD061|nr:homocitrate synthase [Acuticoccus sediminis]